MHGVLIDLDGVIWEGSRLVTGAPAAIDWLTRKGIPYLFVTNTTSRPRRLIVDKLRSLGVHADAKQILTPPVAADKWLADNSRDPAVLIVPDATKEDFTIRTAEPDDASTVGDIGAIVIGDIGDAWTYPLMNQVFRLLMRDPAPALIALGMTRYWRAEDGLRLDVAPFIKAFEHAAGCEALVLGKPSPDFFAVALDEIGCGAADTLMIGDDLYGDVLGAQDAGLRGMLVKTGKFRRQDLEADVKPDAILDSIAALPDWWSREHVNQRVNSAADC
ncbi:MAG: TIGR01458 family HAD-type hydrolase [Gammaproteobacteria bacterium]|jgi:HAD superfamily hydrolase (TIGR01458 family)|nr:TIGR01458 family HAD-type hydrolase [Gammaproteobacteria bacterium]MDP6616794.1 TIGR01458 family HAD-type hydrolase [Gammaproteobacteria bacterium]MDP6696008.1 TIGR01458 family HAD-type hydrolase [Gammaproteobacteria bacterium]MDP7042142.1 TIGR01458 family HAD-type hydrolase [Gammaproteobacteria bacterium]